MDNLSFDVLVVGGGAAGLMAALEIALTGRSVAVLEAKERLGGRIFTVKENNLPVELGAEFVHGKLPLTLNLLQKAAAKKYKVQGTFWQYKSGELNKQEDMVEDYDDLAKAFKKLNGDKPVSDFLKDDLEGDKHNDLRKSLQNYVEGYYAADTTKASTTALCEELTEADDEQYRTEDGYAVLVAYLEEQCRRNGVQFFLSHAATQLHWKNGEAVAVTEKVSFAAQKVLLTVSLGVLQAEAITFFPALPQVKEWAQKLGYGHVIKITMLFEDAFWKNETLTAEKNLSDLCFLFSEEIVPTWWTHYPKQDNVLIGWLGGPRAGEMQFLSDEEIKTKTIFSLSKIFNLDVIHLRQKLVSSHFYNWSADGHFRGAYSYEVVGGAEIQKRLQESIEQTIFFAGEGLHQGLEIGTVEAALINGRDAAHRLIASFSA